MNAERKFLFACLIFALVIYAIHAFGLFDLLTDLPPLTDTHSPERIVRL
ncbi:inner membrane protein [Escherichia coli]|nr:inner membrane protein [Escherichia coli]